MLRDLTEQTREITSWDVFRFRLQCENLAEQSAWHVLAAAVDATYERQQAPTLVVRICLR